MQVLGPDGDGTPPNVPPDDPPEEPAEPAAPSAAELGKWGDVIDFPIVPVAAALLPNGKVRLLRLPYL